MGAANSADVSIKFDIDVSQGKKRLADLASAASSAETSFEKMTQSIAKVGKANTGLSNINRALLGMSTNANKAQSQLQAIDRVLSGSGDKFFVSRQRQMDMLKQSLIEYNQALTDGDKKAAKLAQEQMTAYFNAYNAGGAKKRLSAQNKDFVFGRDQTIFDANGNAHVQHIGGLSINGHDQKANARKILQLVQEMNRQKAQQTAELRKIDPSAPDWIYSPESMRDFMTNLRNAVKKSHMDIAAIFGEESDFVDEVFGKDLNATFQNYSQKSGQYFKEAQKKYGVRSKMPEFKYHGQGVTRSRKADKITKGMEVTDNIYALRANSMEEAEALAREAYLQEQGLKDLKGAEKQVRKELRDYIDEYEKNSDEFWDLDPDEDKDRYKQLQRWFKKQQENRIRAVQNLQKLRALVRANTGDQLKGDDLDIQSYIKDFIISDDVGFSYSKSGDNERAAFQERAEKAMMASRDQWAYKTSVLKRKQKVPGQKQAGIAFLKLHKNDEKKKQGAYVAPDNLVTKQSVQKATAIQEAWAKTKKQVQDTKASSQKMMYHWGNLSDISDSRKTHQLGGQVVAYIYGKKNNTSFGDGTGAYTTTDVSQYTKPGANLSTSDPLRKINKLDVSKLNLFEQNIQQRADKFFNFQHTLERYVMSKANPNFHMFDEQLKYLTSDKNKSSQQQLFEQAKAVMSNYSMIFDATFSNVEEFTSWLSQMTNLVKATGMDENGRPNPQMLAAINQKYGVDDIKTRFMKQLGFEGTNLTGTSYNSLKHGNVIYDVNNPKIIRTTYASLDDAQQEAGIETERMRRAKKQAEEQKKRAEQQRQRAEEQKKLTEEQKKQAEEQKEEAKKEKKKGKQQEKKTEEQKKDSKQQNPKPEQKKKQEKSESEKSGTTGSQKSNEPQKKEKKKFNLPEFTGSYSRTDLSGYTDEQKRVFSALFQNQTKDKDLGLARQMVDLSDVLHRQYKQDDISRKLLDHTKDLINQLKSGDLAPDDFLVRFQQMVDKTNLMIKSLKQTGAIDSSLFDFINGQQAPFDAMGDSAENAGEKVDDLNKKLRVSEKEALNIIEKLGGNVKTTQRNTQDKAIETFLKKGGYIISDQNKSNVKYNSWKNTARNIGQAKQKGITKEYIQSLIDSGTLSPKMLESAKLALQGYVEIEKQGTAAAQAYADAEQNLNKNIAAKKLEKQKGGSGKKQQASKQQESTGQDQEKGKQSGKSEESKDDDLGQPPVLDGYIEPKNKGKKLNFKGSQRERATRIIKNKIQAADWSLEQLNQLANEVNTLLNSEPYATVSKFENISFNKQNEVAERFKKKQDLLNYWKKQKVNNTPKRNAKPQDIFNKDAKDFGIIRQLMLQGFKEEDIFTAKNGPLSNSKAYWKYIKDTYGDIVNVMNQVSQLKSKYDSSKNSGQIAVAMKQRSDMQANKKQYGKDLREYNKKKTQKKNKTKTKTKSSTSTSAEGTTTRSETRTQGETSEGTGVEPRINPTDFQKQFSAIISAIAEQIKTAIPAASKVAVDAIQQQFTDLAKNIQNSVSQISSSLDNLIGAGSADGASSAITTLSSQLTDLLSTIQQFKNSGKITIQFEPQALQQSVQNLNAVNEAIKTGKQPDLKKGSSPDSGRNKVPYKSIHGHTNTYHKPQSESKPQVILEQHPIKDDDNINVSDSINVKQSVEFLYNAISEVLNQISSQAVVSFNVVRDSLLEIADIAQQLGLSSNQNEFLKTIKGWSQADQIITKHRGQNQDAAARYGYQRGVFINTKTGQISNPFTYDQFDSFNLTDYLYDDTKRYNGFAHSHPMGIIKNPFGDGDNYKTIGYDLIPSGLDGDFGGAIQGLKNGIPEQFILSGGKMLHFDYSKLLGGHQNVLNKIASIYHNNLLDLFQNHGGMYELAKTLGGVDSTNKTIDMSVLSNKAIEILRQAVTQTVKAIPENERSFSAEDLIPQVIDVTSLDTKMNVNPMLSSIQSISASLQQLIGLINELKANGNININIDTTGLEVAQTHFESIFRSIQGASSSAPKFSTRLSEALHEWKQVDDVQSEHRGNKKNVPQDYQDRIVRKGTDERFAFVNTKTGKISHTSMYDQPTVTTPDMIKALSKTVDLNQYNGTVHTHPKFGTLNTEAFDLKRRGKTIADVLRPQRYNFSAGDVVDLANKMLKDKATYNPGLSKTLVQSGGILNQLDFEPLMQFPKVIRKISQRYQALQNSMDFDQVDKKVGAWENGKYDYGKVAEFWDSSLKQIIAEQINAHNQRAAKSKHFNTPITATVDDVLKHGTIDSILGSSMITKEDAVISLSGSLKQLVSILKQIKANGNIDIKVNGEGIDQAVDKLHQIDQNSNGRGQFNGLFSPDRKSRLRGKLREGNNFDPQKSKQQRKENIEKYLKKLDEQYFSGLVDPQENNTDTVIELKKKISRKIAEFINRYGQEALNKLDVGGSIDFQSDATMKTFTEMINARVKKPDEKKQTPHSNKKKRSPKKAKPISEEKTDANILTRAASVVSKYEPKAAPLRAKQQLGIATTSELKELQRLQQQLELASANIQKYNENRKQSAELAQIEAKAQQKINEAIENGRDAYETQLKKGAQLSKSMQEDALIRQTNKQLQDIANRKIEGLDISSYSDKIRDLNIGKASGTISELDYIKKTQAQLNKIRRVQSVVAPGTDTATARRIMIQSIIDQAMRKGQAISERDIAWTEKTTKSGAATGTAKATIVNSAGQDEVIMRQYDATLGYITKADSTLKKHQSTFEKFASMYKNKLLEMGTYLGSFVSFYQVWGALKQGINTVKQFDTALTEMRKVSDENISTLKSFQTESFNIADSVGTTALQIQQSTADFMRLGQSLDQAKESAANASLLLNVSEFDSIDDATTSLIAMTQAFDDYSQMQILDSLNKVGNQFSISTKGLSVALQKSASALKTEGNDLAESIALLTAGNQVVQDPESVGAAMKVISLRLAGQKQTLKDQGEDVEDMVETTSKLQEGIMNATRVASNNFQGINIEDQNGNLRSTYDIIVDIAKIWKEIGENDLTNGTNKQAYLLQTMAGKMRSNVLASILQSPDILQQSYQAAQNSQGSAQTENQKFLDSIEGRQQVFQNKLQEITTTLLDSSIVKWVVDSGSAVLGFINDLISGIGSLGAAITGVVAGKGVFQFFKNFDSLAALGAKAGTEKGILGQLLLGKANGSNIGEVFSSLLGKGLIDSSNLQNLQNVEPLFKKIFGDEETTDLFTPLKENFQEFTDALQNDGGIIQGIKEKLIGLKNSLIGIVKSAIKHPLITAGALGVAALVAGVTAYDRYKKKMIETATEATSNWNKSKQSLQNYVGQYIQLKTQLDSGDLSEEQQIGVKQQILDLQRQIVQQYGAQASGIDLVNGKLSEQVSRLNEVSQNQAIANIAKHNTEYMDAIKEMQKERTYTIFTGYDELDDDLKSQVDEILSKHQGFKIGYDQAKLTGFTPGFQKIEFVGNVSQAHDALMSVIADLNRIQHLSPEQTPIFQKLGTQANAAAEDVSKTLDSYEANANSYIEQIMFANGGNKNISALSSAISNYNDALFGSDQQAIDSARQRFKKEQQQMQTFVTNLANTGRYSPQINKAMVDYFATIQKSLNTEQIKFHDFKEILSDTFNGEQFDEGNKYANAFDDSLQQIAKDVKGMDLDEVDIRQMWDIKGTTEQQRAVKSLAEAFGLTNDLWGSGTAEAEAKLRQFINALIQAGAITGQVASQAAAAEEQLGSVWDDHNLSDIQAASQQKELGDNYDAYVKNLKRAKELRESGDVGTKQFKAIAKSFSPSGSTGWKNFDQNRGDADSWFSGDETKDITNFLNEMKQAGFATQDEAGEWSLGIMNLGQVAKKTVRPVGEVVAMLGLLNDKGFDVTAYGNYQEALSGLTDKTVQLSEAEYKLAQMRKLQKEGDGDYSRAISEQQELVERLRNQKTITAEMIPEIVKDQVTDAKERASVARQVINQMYQDIKATQADTSIEDDIKTDMIRSMKEQIQAFAKQNGLILDITGETLTVDENSDQIQKTKEAIDAYQRGNQKQAEEIAKELASAEYSATHNGKQSILSKLGFNLQGVDTENTQSIAQAVSSQLGNVAEFFKANGLTTDMQNLSSDITSNADANTQALISAIFQATNYKEYNKNKKKQEQDKEQRKNELEYHKQLATEKREKENKEKEAKKSKEQKQGEFELHKQLAAERKKAEISKKFSEDTFSNSTNLASEYRKSGQERKAREAEIQKEFTKDTFDNTVEFASKYKKIGEHKKQTRQISNQALKLFSDIDEYIDQVAENTLSHFSNIDKKYGKDNKHVQNLKKKNKQAEIQRNIPDEVEDYVHEQGFVIDSLTKAIEKRNKPYQQGQAQAQIEASETTPTQTEFHSNEGLPQETLVTDSVNVQSASTTVSSNETNPQGEIPPVNLPYTDTPYTDNNYWKRGITDLPTSSSETAETTTSQGVETLQDTTIQSTNTTVETSGEVETPQAEVAQIEIQEPEKTGSADTREYSTFEDVDRALYGEVQPSAAVVAKIMQDWGIPTDQTQFGNIDLNNRQLINWDQDTVTKFKEAIQSWGTIPDELVGSYSTVLGSSGEWEGRSIAYSPLDQREGNMPYYLSSDQIDQYMMGIISNAIRDHGEGFSPEDLINADKQGYTLENGQKIDKLIAAVSDGQNWEKTAVIGQLMHFLGSNGALGGVLNSTQFGKQAQQPTQASQTQQGTVSTQQEVTGRMRITDVDAPEDTSVPVTGQMETVQNEVSQTPEVQVKGVMGTVTQTVETATVMAKVQASGGDEIQDLKEQASGNVTINSNVSGNAQGKLSGIVETKKEIENNPNVNISANVAGNASSQTSSILSNLQNIQAKGNITNTITTVKIQKTEKQGGSAAGTFRLPAHTHGTVLLDDEEDEYEDELINSLAGYAFGSFKIPAHATGTSDVALKNDEDAIVNELGTESIVRDGKWFPIPGGPHVETLKKGDIVFSKKQTQQLVKTGKASGHAKAYAMGTVPGMPAHPFWKSPQEIAAAAAAASASSVGSPWTSSTPSSSSSGGDSKATDENTSSTKKNTDATDKNTKSKKNEGQVFDWVASRLSYLADKTASFADAITDYISYTDKIKLLVGKATEKTKERGKNGKVTTTTKANNGGQLKALINEIVGNRAGSIRYQKEADKVKNPYSKKDTKKVLKSGKKVAKKYKKELSSSQEKDLREGNTISTKGLKGKTKKAVEKQNKKVKNNKGAKANKKFADTKKMIDAGYTIDIENIKDEKLATAIQDYQNYHDSAVQAKNAIAELTRNLVELYATWAQSPAEEAEKQIERLTNGINGLTAAEARLDAISKGGSTAKQLDDILGKSTNNDYTNTSDYSLNAARADNRNKTQYYEKQFQVKQTARERTQNEYNQFKIKSKQAVADAKKNAPYIDQTTGQDPNNVTKKGLKKAGAKIAKENKKNLSKSQIKDLKAGKKVSTKGIKNKDTKKEVQEYNESVATQKAQSTVQKTGKKILNKKGNKKKLSNKQEKALKNGKTVSTKKVKDKKLKKDLDKYNKSVKKADKKTKKSKTKDKSQVNKIKKANKQGAQQFQDQIQANIASEQEAAAELAAQRVQEIRDNFDSINDQFSTKASYQGAVNKLAEKDITSKQARGNFVTSAERDLQKGNLKASQQIAQDQAAKLQAELEKGVNEGLIVKGSKEWQEMQEQILSCQQQVEDYNNQIHEMQLKKFDDINNKLSTELSLLQSINKINQFGISDADEFGNFVSADQRNYQIQNTYAEKAVQESLATQLQDQLKASLASGQIQPETEEFKKLTTQINEATIAAHDLGVEAKKIELKKFSDITNDISTRLGLAESVQKYNQRDITRADTFGNYVTKSQRNQQMADLSSNEALKREEADRLQAQLGLSVANGMIEYGSLEWQNLTKQIQDARNAAEDYNIQIKQTELKKFDDINNKLETRMSLLQSIIKLNEQDISDADTFGNYVTASQRDLQQANLARLRDEKQNQANELQAQLNESVANGFVQVGSEEWEKLQKQINEANAEVHDYNVQIKQTELKKFDDINKLYETQISHLQSIHTLTEQNITDAERYGDFVTSAQRDQQKANLAELKSRKALEASALQAQLDRDVASGVVEEGSLEWMNLQKQINEATAATHEYALQIKDTDIKKIQDITDHYNKIVENMQSIIDLNNVWYERDDVVGNYKKASYYTDNIAAQQGIAAKRRQEAVAAQRKFNELVDQGVYVKGSDSYIAKQTEINNLWKESYDAQNEVSRLSAEFIQYQIDGFNRVIEKQQEFISNLNTMSGLINDAAKWDFDTGNLTEMGQLSMTVDKESYNQALSDIQAISAEKDRLLRELQTNVNYGQEAYDEDIKELTSKQMSALQDAKSALESFTQTVETTAQKQLDALNKVIDKRTEALQKQKQMHDYDKQLKNSNKEIALLQAQSRALQNLTDAESKAMKARIDAQITTKRDELKDTVRDHTVDLQTQGLSELQNKLQENYERWSHDFEASSKAQLAVMQSTNVSTYQLGATMNEILAAYGTNMSQMGVKVDSVSVATTAAVTGLSGLFNGFTQNTSAYDLAVKSNDDLQAKFVASMTGPVVDSVEPRLIAAMDSIQNKMSEHLKGQTGDALIGKNKEALLYAQGVMSTSINSSQKEALAQNRAKTDKNLTDQATALKQDFNRATTNVTNALNTHMQNLTNTINGDFNSIRITIIDSNKASVENLSGTINSSTENLIQNIINSDANAQILTAQAISSNANMLRDHYWFGNMDVREVLERTYNKVSDGFRSVVEGLKKVASKLKGKKKKIGSRSINKNDRYMTQEAGGEIITTKDGVLIPLKAGDGVIPSQLTEKLFEMARAYPNLPGASNLELPNIQSAGSKSNVTVTYGSLLTVNGNVDKDILPDLKTILQESYAYTQKKLAQDALKGGMRKRY